MHISPRNQLVGTVSAIEEGAVGSIVTLNVGGGNSVTAYVSIDSVKELNLSANASAMAIFRATSVLVSTSECGFQNMLKGKIVAIQEGAVCGLVKMEIASGDVVTSDALLTHIKSQGLAVGKECYMFVNPFDVVIGVD